jgi:hypothetical protein
MTIVNITKISFVGDEIELNQAKSSKANNSSSIVNFHDEKHAPLKPEKRSDTTLFQQEEPREPKNEIQGGSGDENNKTTSKKKKKNQNRSQLFQTKNVDINGIVNNLPLNNSSQSATSKNPTNLAAIKQDTKRSDEVQAKKDHQSQPMEQIQNQGQVRFSCRAGHSKPKR